MKGKKRFSPFEKLVREIEAYMADICYQSQLDQLANRAINHDFVLGQCMALRFILERAHAIYHSRSIGCELEELSPEEFLQEFRNAMQIRDS